MLPTFTVPTNTAVNPLNAAANNLLPGEATEPVAAFATEMKLFRTIPVSPPDSGEYLPLNVPAEPGDLLLAGSEDLLSGGELLPEDGKALPAELRVVLDELRGLDGLPTDPADVLPLVTGEALPADRPLSEAYLEGLPVNAPGFQGERPVLASIDADADVELPPGLRFETRLTTMRETLPATMPGTSRGSAAGNPLQAAIAVATGNAVSDDAATRIAPGPQAAIPSTELPQAPERQAVIDRLAALAGVPADKLAALAERRDISTPDLERLADFVARRQGLPEQAAAASVRPETLNATPRPAPTARIDGTAIDGKSQRFRPLGVGQPLTQTPPTAPEDPSGRVVAELDVDDSPLPRPAQPRADVVAAEGLRAEAMLSAKPSPGTFQVAAPQPGPSASAPSPTLQTADTSARPLPGSIDVPVKDASWGDRLNDRVVMMANNRLQNVDLRLSPAELGPLRVKVSVEDGTANVSFVAQHAVTRDAIEQALPRLKTLLEQNGIDLGNTSVDQHSPEQGMAQADTDSGESRGGDDLSGEQRSLTRDGDREAGAGNPGRESVVRLSRGLLDTFA